MWIYYLLFGVFIIGMLFENKSNSNKFLFVACLLLFFMFAFRSYNVGKDTPTYIAEYINGTSYLRTIDVGFTVLLTVLREYDISSRLFLAIISFIIILPIFLYIKNWTTENRSFIIILYMTIGNMTFNLAGMRQSIAISSLLLGLAIVHLIKNKYIQYVVLFISIALAFTFHNSAQLCILVLPMFWLAERDFLFKKEIMILLLGLPLLGLVFGSYFGMLVDYFMINKYENYEREFGDSNILHYFVIPYSMFIYVTWLLINVEKIEIELKFAYLCALVYVIAASASMYMPILARLELYFSLQFMCLIGSLTARIPSKFKPLVIPAITLLCILHFLISTPGGTLAIDNYELTLE